MHDSAVPERIVCVDCGGTCHLLGAPDHRAPDGGWTHGQIASYRCGDCQDRWDVVVELPAAGEA